MRHFKNPLKRGRCINRWFVSMLVLLLLPPVLACAHYAVFPEATRSILIDYSAFQKQGEVYFSPTTPEALRQTMLQTIGLANARVTTFWGSKLSHPKIIFCETDEAYQTYGNKFGTPAANHLNLFGSYIVVSKDGLDFDIIAHEICHAELQQRIGWRRREFKIPAWFDEGLAMQVDERAKYSEASWQQEIAKGIKPPDLQQLKKINQFATGTADEVRINYTTAKHEISRWMTNEKLAIFIERIKHGDTFEQAYKP